MHSMYAFYEFYYEIWFTNWTVDSCNEISFSHFYTVRDF